MFTNSSKLDRSVTAHNNICRNSNKNNFSCNTMVMTRPKTMMMSLLLRQHRIMIVRSNRNNSVYRCSTTCRGNSSSSFHCHHWYPSVARSTKNEIMYNYESSRNRCRSFSHCCNCRRINNNHPYEEYNHSIRRREMASSLRCDSIRSSVRSTRSIHNYSSKSRGEVEVDYKVDIDIDVQEKTASPSGGRKEKGGGGRGGSKVQSLREEGEAGKLGALQLIDTNPPRGTRDFLPSDMRLRKWLFDHFHAVSRSMNFEEVDYPVLESESLFLRKAGEEISEQLYNFEDKGGRRVALRPELTPSLARLVLGQGKSLSLPIKWYAIGQCWRYERTTRGRRREHYQWNMDVIGVGGSDAEAELLSAIVNFFSRVGLTENEVGLRISSRKVLQRVLEKYGVREEQFGPVCIVVDKVDKVPREKVVEMLSDEGVPPDGIDGILDALQMKSVTELKRLLGDEDEAVAEIEAVFSLADGYGIGDWIELDMSVVRGLAYYTGMVFEGFDRSGQLRAICGGGRYDRLLGTFGGENSPCCGFGFGDAVIVELLAEKGLLPNLDNVVNDVVVAMEDELRSPAAGIANQLRKAGRVVDLILERKKMKWVFKHADKVSAERLIIVGENEWKDGKVRIKTLATREECDVSIKDL